MSSNSVVRVSGLGKCYQIYPRPVDRLREIASLRRRKYHSEFWALKDISFEVNRGETLGLVDLTVQENRRFSRLFAVR